MAITQAHFDLCFVCWLGEVAEETHMSGCSDVGAGLIHWGAHVQ